MVNDFMIGKYLSSYSLEGESFEHVGRIGNSVHCEPIRVMIEEGILEIYVCGHVRDCHVVDAAYRMDQGQIGSQ
jgi:hypothetical protein